MGKFESFVAIAPALAAGPSLACHPVGPDRIPIDSYESVFLGRVTGIHLVGYENALVGEPDAYIDGQGINFTDGSAPALVKTAPIRVHHGKVEKVVELRLVGCTAPLPELKERGLFFVNPESGSAATVWESEESFAYWMERLGFTDDDR